jgi:hypothetical protein
MFILVVKHAKYSLIWIRKCRAKKEQHFIAYLIILCMDLEAELLKSLPKDELETLVAERIKSFQGLLTREVALRLIAKEKGLLKAEEEKEYALGQIPRGAKKVTFRASISRIWPVATYASGKRSRVVEVSAEGTTIPLVLWNQDTELGKGIRLKDEIIVRGAYESNGEMHLGYSGKIEVSKHATFSELENLTEGKRAHVRGFVSKVSGFGQFGRDGKAFRAFVFTLSDGKDETQCVVWEGPERAANLREGDEVILEGASVNEGKLLVDDSSRMHMRRTKEMLIGEIKTLECDGEKLIAKVGDRILSLDRRNALRLIQVEAADDIALSTIVSLKKHALINTKIALKAQEKDGQIVIGG